VIISEPQRKAIQRVLNLANLPSEITNANQVEVIFENPWLGVFKRKVEKKDDVKGYHNLRNTVREWLTKLIEGGDLKRGEIRDKVIHDFSEASVETAEIPVVDMQGEKLRLQFKTWGVPRLAFDGKLNLKFDAEPFLSGIHANVLYGMILLFIDNRWRNLARCAARRGDGVCNDFYLKTKQLRVACSPTCKRTLRHQQIYRAVKKIRERKKSEPKKKKARRRSAR